MISPLIRLGFEVGTGAPVEIPLKHLAVTGQTQESGKTTTLEALIDRSGLSALTFVTKRGEGAFTTASRIQPYLKQQGDWQYVASILEASRGEKLKFERPWIIRASKGASTLAQVHHNVKKALEDPKVRGLAADVYLTLDAYLDVVVPELGRIRWANELTLFHGINVLDLTGMPLELQHLVIQSSLDFVLEHMANIVVVVPEAWKFIPQGRKTPVKLAAVSYIRQGAALRNFLWLDSQDLGGIEKEFMRSVPVTLIGVQREANEIKRTLSNIPAGISKPSAADIATLTVGQFFACWGKHAIKTYVQPAWMDDAVALRIATGELRNLPRQPKREKIEPTGATVNETEARELREENARLRRRIEELENAPSSNDKAAGRSRGQDTSPTSGGDAGSTPAGANGAFDYEQLRARLMKDPVLLRVLTQKPELEVAVERKIIKMDGSALPGRIARLIARGFFKDVKRHTDAKKELERTGDSVHDGNLSRELRKLVTQGFLISEDAGYQEVPGMKVNIVESR